MGSDIKLIVDKFPGKKDQIIALYTLSNDFRQLCNDYILSLRSIKELSCDPLADKELEHDYEGVRKELEEELARILTNSKLDD